MYFSRASARSRWERPALTVVGFPAWTAWASIGMGVAFIAELAAARNTMPVLPHLGTSLIGSVALVEATDGGDDGCR